MDILNLSEHWDIVERTEGHDEYEFKIRYTQLPTVCPQCHFMFPRLQRFGKKVQPFFDLPIHGKSVLLWVIRARFRCQECHGTFYQVLDDLDDTRRATRRFVAYVEARSLTRTFTSLADELNVDEKTIRNIFGDYITRQEKSFVFVTPRWLGIDEVHLNGKPRCVLANIEAKAIFDMLKDRKKETVIRRLRKIPDLKTIKLVAIDMWASYRDAVQTAIPHATIVIDKFHVVRMANDALEKVRRRIREELTDRQRRTLMHDRFILLKRKRDLKPEKLIILDVWLDRFPDLKAAYTLKEDFYDIWDAAENSTDALKCYRAWADGIPENLAWAFNDIMTAVKNWECEIFAYFDHRITNAFTESLNGLTRVADRMGRGYSFNVLRAKILYTKGVIKMVAQAKPSESPEPSEPTGYLYTLVPWTEGDLTNLAFGAEMDRLIELLLEETSTRSPHPPTLRRGPGSTLVVLDDGDDIDLPSINQSE